MDYKIGDKPRTQDMEPLFKENGAFYVTRADKFLKTNDEIHLKNAIKYSTTDTDIKIYGNYDSDNDTVSVYIANKGISLPSDEIELIFTRGYRSKDATNIYPAGTGFGMYIAKRIIDIHEGKITAFTDKNGFSVFQVTLSVKGLKGKTKQRESKDSTNRR